MTEKYNDATRNRPDGERIIDAPTVFIDLPAYIKQIKEEHAWHKSDRNSITVFKTDDMRIVLGALHKDAELPTHKAEGTMNIQVLDGRLAVHTDELATPLTTGQAIAIHKNCDYWIVATEETVYLLTITGIH